MLLLFAVLLTVSCLLVSFANFSSLLGDRRCLGLAPAILGECRRLIHASGTAYGAEGKVGGGSARFLLGANGRAVCQFLGELIGFGALGL